MTTNTTSAGAESEAPDLQALPVEAKVVGSDRVLAALSALASYPDGVSLDELARVLESPKSTVHRALKSLRRAGLATQDFKRGTYTLGDEFLRLAFTFHERRPAHLRVAPVLERLAEHFGETAHYAVREGHQIVYRAKVDPPVGAIRLTSVVGGRNPVHCTAVGKLLLAHTMPDDALADWLDSGPALEQRTANTKVSADALLEEMPRIRERGYAIEEGENEMGISCLAVPIHLTSSSLPDGAISISAVSYRTPLSRLIDEVDHIKNEVSPLHIGS